MAKIRPMVNWLTLLMLAGCAAVPLGPAREGGLLDPVSSAASPQKILTVSALNSIKAFGAWSISLAGGTLTYNELHSAALATNDERGGLEPRLAARLPSFDDGSIAILPDGRMQTIWKLRPNVRWHDGSPFTADDLIFTLEVNRHPEIPLVKSAALTQMESIEAPDPHTAIITWRTTFYRPLDLGLREFYPLPTHMLSDAFRGDLEVFRNLPYWTTEWSHLGPFRLVDFGLGESLVFERFDEYFLGRPKLDKIVLRIIPDENTLAANLQARAVDVTTENTLSPDVVLPLREEWNRTAGGMVAQRQGNWRFLAVQFNPEWGRPPELTRDVRIRRGLYFAIDRDALREVVTPGFADTEADSFMLKNDPRAPLVGKPFERYRYDPARAAQELAEAGWRRGSDGRMVNQAGERVQIHLRTTPGRTKDIEVIAPYWRQLGIEVTEETITGQLVLDKEYAAKFSGLDATAKGTGDEIFRFSFDSRLRPTPQNGYTGGNPGYSNPDLDRLIARLFSTIDQRDQAMLLREMGEMLAANLPVLPIYFDVRLAAVVKGVQALDDFAGAIGPGFMSRNAHLWDRT